MTEREEKFEKMLAAIQNALADTTAKMERLKAEKKEKTATFRQLMGDKLLYQNMLSMYRIYGLLEDET